MNPSLDNLVAGHFLPYQRNWLLDNSRFKIGLWARQSGKDFTATAEAVLRCYEKDKQTWIILASGERQALESLRKAKEWVEIFKISIEGVHVIRETKGALLRAAEIEFSNGSRLLALPALPETIRGYSANLILTEFAFHDDPVAIWRAIYPSISNPLTGGQKKLRIITTPNGPGNKFHDLWTNGKNYSRHFLPIKDAVAQGLAIDLDELRAGLNDPEGWAQEYECQFIDGNTVLLPYDLIATCESDDCMGSVPAPGADAGASPARSSSELYAGIDFGRKRDRTVCWILERLGDILWTREVLVLENLSTPRQIEALRPRLQSVRRAAVDYTGAGVGLGDQLAHEFAEHNPAAHRFGKIDLCQITASLNCELYSKLRIAFEKRALRIPAEPAIREDLHAVRRNITAAGQVTYRSPHSADGHSDRCAALALALRAAGEPRPPIQKSIVATRDQLNQRAANRRARQRR